MYHLKIVYTRWNSDIASDIRRSDVYNLAFDTE